MTDANDTARLRESIRHCDTILGRCGHRLLAEDVETLFDAFEDNLGVHLVVDGNDDLWKGMSTSLGQVLEY